MADNASAEAGDPHAVTDSPLKASQLKPLAEIDESPEYGDNDQL